MELCNDEGVDVTEFTVAPQVNPKQGLPYHEWLIEFSNEPADLNSFRNKLDKLMQEKNIYYKDLISGNILAPLHLTSLPKESFRNYMKSIGKLGGQNKVPRLTNDRKLVDAILSL